MIDSILRYFRSRPPPSPQGTVSEQMVKLYRFADGSAIHWRTTGGHPKQPNRQYLVEWRQGELAPVFNQETATLFAALLDQGLARKPRVTITEEKADQVTANVFEPNTAEADYGFDEADHVLGAVHIDLNRYHYKLSSWKDRHGLK